MQQEINWDKYIGIPYRARGRDITQGLDCWGLVRYVYASEFNIALPSLANDYADDEAQIAEVVAREKEGWAAPDVYRTGDAVIFRMLGQETHIGVITRPGYFLHVREGQTSAIERLDSALWKKRVTGIYRYINGCETLDVVALPHPLKTVRLDINLASGFSLDELASQIRKENAITEELSTEAVIAIDGVYIPRHLWSKTIPQAGSRVEYRATMQKGALKGLIVAIAVMVFQQYYLAPMLGAAGITGMTASIVTGVVGMGLNMVGNMLMNAIFPVRPAQFGSAAGIRPMNMLQGGNNQANRFGSIPVVLGTFEYTPPIGANNYVETNASTSYLRQILVWGYGPILVSNLRLGATTLSSYSEVEVATINGWEKSKEDYTSFNSLYGTDVEQIAPSIKLLMVDGWAERAFTAACDKISVSVNFPQGLFGVDPEKKNPINKRVTIGVQYRLVGTPTWSETIEVVNQAVFNLVPQFYKPSGLSSSAKPVYAIARIYLDKTNKLILKMGSQYIDSSLTSLAEPNYGLSQVANPAYSYPPLAADEAVLFDIKLFGNTIISTTDHRATQTIGVTTGMALTVVPHTGSSTNATNVGFNATVAAGTMIRSQVTTIDLTKNTKIAFSENVNFNVPHGIYEVRVKRTNDNGGTTANAYDDAYLSTITAYANVNPINFAKPLAMTALRIKATNQLNGNLEGISGTVQSICLDYDDTTSTWSLKPTSNPASLLRYLWQHPANAKRVADSKINIAALEDFHNFCRLNNFSFNHVMTSQQSVDEVARDIASAGRASPTEVDGLKTVIIDRPRSEIAQHLTPHNSWGFSGVKTLPIIPHAFRVSFINADKLYQPDERIVYNDGYDATNATLFESISLPGVTHSDIVYKHARFHLAQVKLRPETYTLNVDIEHLVCTRGDLVKVTHDVPMWGLGSARIKNRISATVIEIDEDFDMQASASYSVRIRLADGSSIVRNVVAVGADGHYTQLTLTAAVSTLEAETGNLIMFGTIGAESVELIVQSIMPSANMSAQLTLVDYSPAIYDSDLEAIPAFNSHITNVPPLLLTAIKYVPEIVRVASDESVMGISSPGSYIYNIRVSFTNPATLPQGVSHVEGQIDFVDDATDTWQERVLTPINIQAITFPNVIEQAEYRIRLRYVDSSGLNGPWTATTTHTVVGRTTPPSDVVEILLNGDVLSWPAVLDTDLAGYILKFHYGVNKDWGTAHALHDGIVTDSPYTMKVVPTGAITVMIKAIDSLGLESQNIAYLLANMGNPIVANVIETYDWRAHSWAGIYTNATIFSGDLQATNSSLFYGAPDSVFYKEPNALFYNQNYDAMEWVSSSYTPSAAAIGKNITLDFAVAGTDYSIFYRYTGPSRFYKDPNSYFYKSDGSLPFYDPPSEWKIWPGALVCDGNEMQFKVATNIGTTRGLASKFILNIDVPDKFLNLNSVAISAAGTRLTGAIGQFIAITNIQMTLHGGSTAVKLEILDYSASLGPLVIAKDSSGTGVGATIDATLQGY